MAHPRPLRVLVALALVATMVVGIGTGSVALPSQGKLDEARERAQVLEERAGDAEAELRAVEAELEVLEGRLALMEERLAEAVARHREAEAAAVAASVRARAAEDELAAATTELRSNERVLASLARDAHMYGAPSASATMAAVELLGEDSGELADRLHYLTRSLGARSNAIERAGALRIQVEVLTERALAEEAELRRHEQEAESRRNEAATLHAEVMELVSQQSAQVDRAVRLVAEIETERERTEARIGELEEQVERERREREERERRERERREREERERREREARERAARSSGTVAVSAGPTPELRTVGGITVAASLAPQLEALLNHARADGIVLGGHGYRSPEVTARLRRANGCPDVYESPASACRVPTARPGSSMHEKGLAIDFTYRGQTICFPRPASHCSGNAAFDWLQRHAGSYGLRNLPTEAWHWSTNGR